MFNININYYLYLYLLFIFFSLIICCYNYFILLFKILQLELLIKINKLFYIKLLILLTE